MSEGSSLISTLTAVRTWNLGLIPPVFVLILFLVSGMRTVDAVSRSRRLSKQAYYTVHRKLQLWRDYYAEQCWVLQRQRPSFLPGTCTTVVIDVALLLPGICTRVIIAVVLLSATERNFTHSCMDFKLLNSFLNLSQHTPPSLISKSATFSPQTVFMCFVMISEQTENISH